MIAKLTGLIDTLGENFLIIDVNGVGYFVSCSGQTLRNSGSRGERVTLLIETVMRAESLQLFGFATIEEQDCFRLLTTVQGVGMRMGLALLSALPPIEIYRAIASQDKESLTRADGVGPKLASRILTELKDKIPAEIGFISNANTITTSLSPSIQEAVSALVNLGYRRLDAVTAVTKAHQHLGEGTSLNDLIRHGLSTLARTGT
jgi:holliday junction DNA helicase RuvA